VSRELLLTYSTSRVHREALLRSAAIYADKTLYAPRKMPPQAVISHYTSKYTGIAGVFPSALPFVFFFSHPAFATIV